MVEAVSLSNPPVGKIIKQRIDDITEIDTDRIESILEAIQGVIVSFILGVIAAHYIDKLFPKYSSNEDDIYSLKSVSYNLLLI